MPLRKLRNQFALMGVVLTWMVRGVIALVGYRQMTAAVRHEAVARAEEAARVGQRLLEAEFPRLDPNGPLPRDAKLLSLPAEAVHDGTPLYPFIRKAVADGKAEWFALLDEGLCMVSVRRAPASTKVLAALWPLRGANWLPDQIREVVFGSDGHGPESATIIIFEKDIRIATNETLPDGRRATGTRVSEAVARKVLGEGQTWNDRALVVNRWMITSYRPLHSLDRAVIGMLYAGLDEAPYVAQGERNIVLFLTFILGLTLVISAGGWSLGKLGPNLGVDQSVGAGQVLTGYHQYHAIPGNLHQLSLFRHRLCWLWRTVLRCRSQRGWLSWPRLSRKLDRSMPLPRVLHPHPEQRFAATHPR